MINDHRFGHHRFGHHRFLVLLVLITACGEPEKPRPKVLLLGLDGIRVDILSEAHTPNLDALIAEGLYSDDARTLTRTVSGPGWSSMLIGAWDDRHGVTSNDFRGNHYAQYPDFLTRIEQVAPELNTFAVLDWPPLGTEDSGGPLISDAVDVKVLFDGEEGEGGYPTADSLSVAAAVEHLRNEDPDAAFVYIGNVDVVGHSTSSLAPEYRQAIEAMDEQVGALVAAVRARTSYASEDWLILASTDHGRTDDGGHGGDSELERRVFFLATGPSVARTLDGETPLLVDVAVTALAHLGIAIEPEWGLVGRPIGLNR